MYVHREPRCRSLGTSVPALYYVFPNVLCSAYPVASKGGVGGIRRYGGAWASHVLSAHLRSVCSMQCVRCSFRIRAVFVYVASRQLFNRYRCLLLGAGS
jgi:hypothetical protein